MTLLIASLIIIGIITCILWVRFIYWVFDAIERSIRKFRKKTPEVSNPYIEAHKFKLQNDKNYSDYIDWMKAESHGVPIKKIEMLEDVQAQHKIWNLFR